MKTAGVCNLESLCRKERSTNCWGYIHATVGWLSSDAQKESVVQAFMTHIGMIQFKPETTGASRNLNPCTPADLCRWWPGTPFLPLHTHVPTFVI